MICSLVLIYFDSPQLEHTAKINWIKLQTIDPEICSILIFQKRVWNYFLHHISCMIFQEKCFLCYILLTDQISLSEISWRWVYNPKNLINNFIAVITFHTWLINVMFLPHGPLAKELQRKDCWKQYLDYEQSLIKRERNKCWIDFLKKCIKTDIIPAFLKFRVPNNDCF